MSPIARPLHFTVMLFVVASVTLASPDRARADEADEAYLDLVDAMKITSTFGPLVGSIQQVISPLVRQANPHLTDNQHAMIDEAISQAMKDELPKLVVMMAPIYKAAFTPAEMHELAAFYRTPVGEKTIAIMPQLFQQGAAIGQQWAQQMTPQVLEQVKKRMREQGIDFRI